jgi:selenocysteine-specific elongation factor
MSCIGTAGHIDHGKSTLVEALTGIDPDRLVEEKARGMTIDLGFAWLTLPSGREVSIVDVPGHENFIKNMLAGVGGIDAALLVIAADEGIMPQTREHLAILDLLRVPCGVVALTKADLVDNEWLAMVSEEVAEFLRPTTLAGSQIISVSALTRQGVPELLTALDAVLSSSQARQNIARPRLPIDRVFSLTGFGTIVTGTLLDGGFKPGQDVEILPQQLKSRIRGLQTHKHQVETTQPGSRVALNLANVARGEMQRGNVVALPGQLRSTFLLDARVHLLSDASRPLPHNAQVDFYSGSQEISARIRLLDCNELQPGQSAWAQLRLSRPAVVARRDRFVLRIPSPSSTIGGGEIIDITPRYHRRHQQAVLQQLQRLTQSQPEELILATLDRRLPGKTKRGAELTEIARECNLSTDVTLATLESLLLAGSVHQLANLWFAQHSWEALIEEAVALVREQHQLYPLRSGLVREEWRVRLQLPSKLASEVFAFLQAQGQLEEGERSSLIRQPGFVPHFTPEQQRQVDTLLARFRAQPYAGPTRPEVEQLLGPEVLNALIEQGQLVKLGDGILLTRESYHEAIQQLVAYLKQHGKMTVAEARDVLDTTRKYIVPLLEHMDVSRITVRRGDERVPGPGVNSLADREKSS